MQLIEANYKEYDLLYLFTVTLMNVHTRTRLKIFHYAIQNSVYLLSVA